MPIYLIVQPFLLPFSGRTCNSILWYESDMTISLICTFCTRTWFNLMLVVLILTSYHVSADEESSSNRVQCFYQVLILAHVCDPMSVI